MELYELGEIVVLGNLESMVIPIDPLQSPHLLEEQIGNK